MEKTMLNATSCRIIDNAALARPGDRIFISSRPFTLRQRIAQPGWPFTENGLINADDIAPLLASGELVEVGVLDAARNASYLPKYKYLATPPDENGGQ